MSISVQTLLSSNSQNSEKITQNESSLSCQQNRPGVLPPKGQPLGLGLKVPKMAVAQNYVPKMACPGKWKHGLKPAVQFLVVQF